MTFHIEQLARQPVAANVTCAEPSIGMNTVVAAPQTLAPIAVNAAADKVLEGLAALDTALQKRAAGKGTLAENSALQRYTLAQKNWYVTQWTAIGVGALAAIAAIPEGGPVLMLLGAAAGWAAGGAIAAWGLPRVVDRARRSVLDASAAKPLVTAFAKANAVEKSAIAALASAWLTRLQERDIDGVYVRKALQKLVDEASQLDPLSHLRGRALYRVHELTRLPDGRATRSYNTSRVEQLMAELRSLDSAERAGAKKYLLQTSYRGEHAIVKFDSGAKRRELLEYLVD